MTAYLPFCGSTLELRHGEFKQIHKDKIMLNSGYNLIYNPTNHCWYLNCKAITAEYDVINVMENQTVIIVFNQQARQYFTCINLTNPDVRAYYECESFWVFARSILYICAGDCYYISQDNINDAHRLGTAPKNYKTATSYNECRFEIMTYTERYIYRKDEPVEKVTSIGVISGKNGTFYEKMDKGIRIFTNNYNKCILPDIYVDINKVSFRFIENFIICFSPQLKDLNINFAPHLFNNTHYFHDCGSYNNYKFYQVRPLSGYGQPHSISPASNLLPRKPYPTPIARPPYKDIHEQD